MNLLPLRLGIALLGVTLATGKAESLAPPLETWGDEVGQWQAPHPRYYEGFNASFEMQSHDGREFLHFDAPVSNKALFTQAVFPLPEGTASVSVTLVYRTEVSEIDDSAPYHGPRLETGWLAEPLPFAEQKGRLGEISVKGKRIAMNLEDTAGEWQELTEELVVPDGATAMNVRLGLINTAGSLYIAQFEVQSHQ